MAGWNAAEELKELFRSGDSGLAAFRTKLNSELYTLGFGCQEQLHGNYDRRRHNRRLKSREASFFRILANQKDFHRIDLTVS